ncbi:hypothetical protein EDB84DRAFT_1562744 [Lactarius hengduanensis]|nr:hypothetical protein EDB84DRAFT_1562744 [Lactarius hengduanensis]
MDQLPNIPCSFACGLCPKVCLTLAGLARHKKLKHPDITPPKDLSSHTRIFHPSLDARPCDKDGVFLQAPWGLTSVPSPAPPSQNNQRIQDWTPFEDRLAFDWAYYHYVNLQSSAAEIAEGLNLWSATSFKHGSTVGAPWRSAKEMYATIDTIEIGSLPFQTFMFQYTGPKPLVPPCWMEEAYELNTRNILEVIQEQLATSDFKSQFDYVPYKEFNGRGERVWSNLMSGQWASMQADELSKEKCNDGAMFVPIVAGSDKTTVSVASGHQEYHPVYVSVGNLTNTAQRAHGNSVLPVAFLPIPKTSKSLRKHVEFQRFCRQLYHRCLELIFDPLRKYMMTPTVVKCPDGHFRRAVFSLGPYIADYPEQVYLAGIVSNWCAKCDATPDKLDSGTGHRRTHEKTDYLIDNFSPGVLWDAFGIYKDVVPFTHSFPRADIHELIAPDLLHQVIKGVFKDHLVAWVGDYLHRVYRESRALEIIGDIDRRISTVPPFPGLRRFPEGRDFTQWTGDDSKALMKVYLGAIAGYLPSAMVRCISRFMDACYLARRNAISGSGLDRFQESVAQFHELRNIFITSGVRTSISLPRQHALVHYHFSIQLFGSPNGLCSSITESKHIKAVKEPWRRSSRYKALSQMLLVLLRLEKLSALRCLFVLLGMLKGTTASNMAGTTVEDSREDLTPLAADEDGVPIEGAPETLSIVTLSEKTEIAYPQNLVVLAQFIEQPDLPFALQKFIFSIDNPSSAASASITGPSLGLPLFQARVRVHHSALATFFAPSDLCGTGGMRQERIRSTSSWYGHPRRDTVFVVLDEDLPGMEGMVVARVQLLFSFKYKRVDYACAYVNWLVRDDDKPDPDTGMWAVSLETRCGTLASQVIDVRTIARAAHLLPVYGRDSVLPDTQYYNSLDRYESFFVNPFVDHHAHEFLTDCQF